MAAVFLALGAWTGTYVSRLPWIAGRLHLSSGVLGMVGLAAGVGAVTTMPFAARFVHSHGPKAATRVLIGCSGLVLVLPALAPNAVLLALALLLAGALVGNTDAAMNVQGVAVERRIGKSIMSGLHGLWSVGVVLGAFAGSLAAREQIDPRLQFAVMGSLILAGGVTATFWFGDEPRPADRGQGAATVPGEASTVPYFAWPRGLALLLGLMAFAAVFVEYTANDWSALFMRWELHASQATAAAATGVFALTMAAWPPVWRRRHQAARPRAVRSHERPDRYRRQPAGGSRAGLGSSVRRVHAGRHRRGRGGTACVRSGRALPAGPGHQHRGRGDAWLWRWPSRA